MEFPAPLKNALEQSSAVLMLGAGASLGAKNGFGHTLPGVKELTRLLAVRFLDASYATAPLTQVADFAIQEAGLFDVQDHIAQMFSVFKPTPQHRVIPTFRWRAIVTTNYDTLIEDAYREHQSPAQQIVPIYKNVDRWDSVMRDVDKVALLKLHGCITDTHDEGCPLILSTDQYVDYTKGRNRLFRLFQDLAAENTIVYLGYGLADQNIRGILQSLDAERVGRTRSFMISKSVDAYGVRYWSQRHVTAIQGTFDEAIQTFDDAIGKNFRVPYPCACWSIGDLGPFHGGGRQNVRGSVEVARIRSRLRSIGDAGGGLRPSQILQRCKPYLGANYAGLGCSAKTHRHDYGRLFS